MSRRLLTVCGHYQREYNHTLQTEIPLFGGVLIRFTEDSTFFMIDWLVKDIHKIQKRMRNEYEYAPFSVWKRQSRLWIVEIVECAVLCLKIFLKYTEIYRLQRALRKTPTESILILFGNMIRKINK